MWYVFPQIQGLGHSGLSRKFGIDSVNEAKAYYNHPVLRARMNEILTVILNSKEGILTLMGSELDARKFLSCMTLFEYATHEQIFEDVLEKKCWGSYCKLTLSKIRMSQSDKP
jgi:uncharacterized protein (DUF1810 family)